MNVTKWDSLKEHIAKMSARVYALWVREQKYNNNEIQIVRRLGEINAYKNVYRKMLELEKSEER